MKIYDITKSTIYGIWQARPTLLNHKELSKNWYDPSKKKSSHIPKLEELDETLWDWCIEKRLEGMAISGPMVIAKGKCLNEKLNLNVNCKFNFGWLRAFKEPNGIR